MNETVPTRAVVEGSALPAPMVSYRPKVRAWRLAAPYAYQDGPCRLEIPAGFEFDLASVPRPLWGLIAPFECSIAAPLLHDALYECGGKPAAGIATPHRTYTRAEADRLFLRLMAEEGVPPWRRCAAYLAVRAFGWTAWRTA